MSKDGGAVAALVDGGASRRRQCPLCDRLGFRIVVGVLVGSGEPRARRPGPHLLFMMLCDGGATNHIRVGRPRSGRVSKGPIGRLVNG